MFSSCLFLLSLMASPLFSLISISLSLLGLLLYTMHVSWSLRHFSSVFLFSVASPKASIRYVDCVVFCRTLYIIMTFWSVKWFKSAFSLIYAGWYSSRLGLIGPVYTWSFSCAFADRISIWFVKMFPFTLGHINVSWKNGYKSDPRFQFPRYI